MSEKSHFITGPRGFEDLLADELTALGAGGIKRGHGGVRFDADLATVYAVCLWSRLGGRLLRHVASLDAATPDRLYAAAMRLRWVELFAGARSFSIHVNLARNAQLGHARYALHRLKDAIVDQHRDAGLPRPDVDRDAPELSLDLAVHADRATLSVDLVGEPLSFRGLRDPRTPAPLRENLAAALLRRAGYDGSQAFVDPMCGGGTLLLEAWMMATDFAPGLRRRHWSLERLPGFSREAWVAARAEAEQRAAAGRQRVEDEGPPLWGADQDERTIEALREQVEALEAEDSITLECMEIEAIRPPDRQGILVTNPPWGRRLGDDAEAAQTYARLGQVLRDRFEGWQAAVLAGEPSHGRAMGLHAARRHKVLAGGLEAQLLRVDVEAALAREAARAERKEQAEGEAASPGESGPELPADLVNRLRKNLKLRRKYAERVETDAYRLYDADLPDYAFAVDVYGERIHVAEYAPPSTIPEATARQRRRAALATIREVTETTRQQVHLKRRERQRGKSQYEAKGKVDEEAKVIVHEGPARFEVQLEGYLDTGLFLDHRPVRSWIREQANRARFLNLFCYTASATVHAVWGGASESTSVDMSATYLAWAERNFDLNFGAAARGGHPRVDRRAHRFVRADVMAWLAEVPPRSYDLIFCDPPTFSNSKRMRDSFDVQRDHAELIESCMRALAPGGTLIFSTNARRFSLDDGLAERFAVDDRSRASLPEDFARRPRIHQVFEIRRKGEAR